jgi:hypothetical protein
MNEDIESIFQGKIVVDEKEIPISFMEYIGSDEDYIVYYNTSSEPIFNCDDENEYSRNSIEFNVYTKGNYLNIVKEIKRILKNNNYDWTGDDGDLYETDTKYHHFVMSFEKLRRI